MTGFCVARIAVNPHLRAAHGIVRAGDLALSADARAAARLLLEAARTQAGAERAEAARAAQAVLAEARAQADALCAAEQARVLDQAAGLLRGLDQARDAVVERAEDIVVDLARALFERLVADTVPRERLQAALARVVQEAPARLAEPQLRVHPDDVALLPALDWPVKPDPLLARGSCRLEAASGQWCASFDAAVDALRAAFADGLSGPAAAG